MPIIKIEFDDLKVKENEIRKLSEVAKKIVSNITGIEDVFVYANSAQIKVNIAPIEIFVEMSLSLIEDQDDLIKKIRLGLSIWKKENKFNYPINLTLIPMQWKFEVGI